MKIELVMMLMLWAAVSETVSLDVPPETGILRHLPNRIR